MFNVLRSTFAGLILDKPMTIARGARADYCRRPAKIG
jgi:hypothetical protein